MSTHTHIWMHSHMPLTYIHMRYFQWLSPYCDLPIWDKGQSWLMLENIILPKLTMREQSHFRSQWDLYLDLSDHGSQRTLLPLKAKSKFSPKSTKPSVLEASWALKGHLHIAGNNESKGKGQTKVNLPLRRKIAECKTHTTVEMGFQRTTRWVATFKFVKIMTHAFPFKKQHLGSRKLGLT